ncbi:MAG: hypothetical protein RL223_4312 [Pseudomonadota bacterium]
MPDRRPAAPPHRLTLLARITLLTLTLSGPGLPSARAQATAEAAEAAGTTATTATPETAAAAEATAASPAPADRVTVRGQGLRPTGAGQRQVPVSELQQVPGGLGDPLKALQALPGITSTHDGSSQPAIRGSRPEDNRYAIDGLPAGKLFHLGGLTSTLHPALVSRFDLQAAAHAAPWGNATGGVIDVRLKAPRTDRLAGSLDLGLLGGDLVLDGPVQPGSAVGVQLAVRRSWLDWVVRHASRGDEDGSDGTVVEMPAYRDWLGRLVWQPLAGHTLTLHSHGAVDRLDYEVPAGSIAGSQQPALIGPGRVRERDRTTALVWERRGRGGDQQRVALGQRDADQASRAGSVLDLDLAARFRFLQMEWRPAPLGRHSLSLGLERTWARWDYRMNLRDVRCTEFEPDCDYSSAEPVAADDHLRDRHLALWAQDRIALGEDWTLRAGWHAMRDAYLQRQVGEPRLALDWQARPRTLLSLAWGRHHQIPDGLQILPTYGNPQLDLLRASHLALSLAEQADAGWRWQVELYRKQLDGLVVADPTTRQYVNGGSGQAHGLELLVQREAREASPWSGWLAVSWAASRRRNDLTGVSFRHDQDQPLNVQLLARHRLPSGWSLGARWAWHSGAPDTAVIGTTTLADGRIRPVYGALNADRLPSYHRLDLRLEGRLRPDLSLYAELINAYGRRNVAGWVYSADYGRRTAQTQMGRIPSAGLKLDF